MEICIPLFQTESFWELPIDEDTFTFLLLILKLLRDTLIGYRVYNQCHVCLVLSTNQVVVCPITNVNQNRLKYSVKKQLTIKSPYYLVVMSIKYVYLDYC